MTYVEFSKLLSECGYDVDLHYKLHEVAVVAQDLGAVMGGDTLIARVNTKHQYWFTMFDFDETLLKSKDWFAICDLCRNLSATPPDERGKRKRKE